MKCTVKFQQISEILDYNGDLTRDADGACQFHANSKGVRVAQWISAGLPPL